MLIYAEKEMLCQAAKSCDERNRRDNTLPDLGFRPKTVRVVVKSLDRIPSCNSTNTETLLDFIINSISSD